MTCGECKHSTRDYHRLIPALACLKNRREFARPDLPAERCPCFERKEEKEVCAECDGTGMVRITVPAHHPRCDGSCAVGCPVPVEDVDVCPSCGGVKEEK